MFKTRADAVARYDHHHDHVHDHDHHDLYHHHLDIKMFKTRTDSAAKLTEEGVVRYVGKGQAGGVIIKLMMLIGHPLGSSRKSVHERHQNSDGV